MRIPALWVAALAFAFASAAPPAAAQTDLGPLTLPTSFTSLPLDEGFETAAGVVPGYMAVTRLDVLTLTPDPEAWANIGQLAPCINPFLGGYALEMGLTPGSTNYHDVRNALVIGIDASGYTGSTDVSCYSFDAGEEADTVDGIWVSDDGVNWYSLFTNWDTNGVDLAWEFMDGMDWGSTPVNTSGRFYLAFVQEDNFPYNDLDGVGIDEIQIPAALPLPELSLAAPLTAGVYATLTCTSGIPNGTCAFLASTTGAGPSTVAGVTMDLSPPIRQVAIVPTDTNGTAVISPLVPSHLSGISVWLQCLVYDPANRMASSSLAEVIL